MNDPAIQQKPTASASHPQNRPVTTKLPVVPATGRRITQEEIDAKVYGEFETVLELDALIRQHIDPLWPDSVQFGVSWHQTSMFGHIRSHDGPFQFKPLAPKLKLSDTL